MTSPDWGLTGLGIPMSFACLLAAGCGSDLALRPAALEPPGILSSAVTGNATNVLSAVVTARVTGADSVAVRYGLAGQALDSTTPGVPPSHDDVRIPVLGLHAETTYDVQLVAHGGGQTTVGKVFAFSTGSLPHDLPRFVAGGSDPTPGFVVLAAGNYGLVIDNSGRVVWYHHFGNGPGLNFQAQPMGRYVARPPAPAGHLAPWVEVDPLGNLTRTLGCARGLQPRFHDLLALADGSYWIMCDETRLVELSGQQLRVTGTVVQHVDEGGALLFEWSPFDHFVFAIADLDPADLTGTSVNWTHGNALDLDVDGNLLVSFRSLSEITKIDTRTGNVIWRMGGPRNEFAFAGVAVPAFARQHGVRTPGPGQVLLLDNLGDPTRSSAKRFIYAEGSRSAWLAGSYGSLPPVTALLGGTTQDLPGDRVLVSFGSAGRVEEYDATGRVVWRIEGETGYVFRAQRIGSLYQPGVSSPR